MALGLVKTNRLGVFAFEGSGLKKLMIVNFVKDIIFIHIKSSELSVKFDQRCEINILKIMYVKFEFSIFISPCYS